MSRADKKRINAAVLGESWETSQAFGRRFSRQKKHRAPPVGRIVALAALVVALVCVLTIGLLAKPDVATTCTDSLQAKIDAAAPYSVVKASGCTYRETITVNKPITLLGTSGSVISGSDRWDSGWVKVGDYWKKGPLPAFAAAGVCRGGTDDCQHPEQVFVDGMPLKQVAENPSEGQFSVDSGRNVTLPIDPSEHDIEVTTRTQWVIGKSSDVTISGFKMTHAANAAQTGALHVSGYHNWTIAYNSISYAHGHNVKLDNGTNLKIQNNDISRAGQLGVGGYKSSVELRGNEIHHNNTEGFDPGWEAGGAKLASVSRLIADSNEVYDNQGTGIWCDLSCESATITDNRIHHNANSAIFYELSDNASISGNVVWENGWPTTGGSWGAAIRSSNSRNVEIYDNVVAWNAGNIAILSSDRGDPQWNDVRDNYVHDNVILSKDYPSTEHIHSGHRSHAIAWLESWDGTLFDPGHNNGGDNNLYWYDSPERSSFPRFYWNRRGLSSLEDYNATPDEENGRYLTDSEKDQIVALRRIPAAPEAR